MDINQLPLELLQEIYSYLSYRELKTASLVCRHWNRASEAIIVRKGTIRIIGPITPFKQDSLTSRFVSWLLQGAKKDDTMQSAVVRNILRNYQTVVIYAYNSKLWEKTGEFSSACDDKPSDTEKSHQDDQLQSYLDFFCSTYRDLKDHLEKIQVFEMELTKREEDVENSLHLRAFKIAFESTSVPIGMIDLQRTFEHLATLKVLELRYLNLTGTEWVYAEHLVELSLEEVAFKDNILLIQAPKLKKLSLPVIALKKVRFVSTTNITHLRLFFPPVAFDIWFNKVACPFIQSYEATHGAVETLSLIRCYYVDKVIEPRRLIAIYAPVVLNVSHLELHQLDLNVDFFVMISHWESLQSLTLVDCVVYYEEDLNIIQLFPVQLPTVQRLVLDGVLLKGAERFDHVVIIGGITILKDAIGYEPYEEEQEEELNLFERLFI